MKQIILLSLIIISGPIVMAQSSTRTHTQSYTQTLRGTILDADSYHPLIGASISIIGTNPTQGIISDKNGNFRFDQLPIGRVNLEISYIGYKTKFLNHINLISAKETVVEVTLEEASFSIDQIVITTEKPLGQALNEMSLASARSIDPEITSRYAGGFNDPSRITANFAGVTNTQDGGNDIIVRGNSPKYISWQLEGVPITNPNHFADQNAVSGVLSTLNNNLVGTSDFHTGAFTADFGNALSGVYDVRLRKGNNEKFEGNASLGLLGTDLTFEGPFNKRYGGSYLLNYRYSTVGFISELGLVDFDALLNFQDASFKVWLPTSRLGTFSLFGLAGKSNFIFEDVDPSLWITPGDRFMQEEKTENYSKGSHLLNTGLNHLLPIDDNSYLKTSIVYSIEGIKDEVFESDTTSSNEGRINFFNDIKKATLRARSIYNHKIDRRNKIRIGATYARSQYKLAQDYIDRRGNELSQLNIDEKLNTLESFVNWKFQATESLSLIAGLHNNNVFYNNKHTIEPRISLSYSPQKKGTFTMAYGQHSITESIPHYFYSREDVSGQYIQPNVDLDLLKAHHCVIGYKHQITNRWQVNLEMYYQDLYNLPVANDINNSFSTINEGLEFQYIDLINEGTGRNYGLELTIERQLNEGFYLMANGTLYESKYTALDGIERNTAYNGNFLINVLAGKEFTGWGKKKNQVFAINAKVFYGGAKYITPLLRSENGALDVRPEEGLFYDHQNAYSKKLDNTLSAVINFSYKWNKPKMTHELYLSFENMTNSQARLLEYFDPSSDDGIGYQTQVQFYPNLLYKIYF